MLIIKFFYYFFLFFKNEFPIFALGNNLKPG